MKTPVIRGIIDRRILVNYHVAPEVLSPLLPAPFRPKLFRGVAIVGICLIRLNHVRPAWLPSGVGISSENAAHRAAVEWDDKSAVLEGVFIRRRDTNSWLNTVAGGRAFPGIHHHAEFSIEESADCFHVTMRGDDDSAIVVRSRLAGQLSTSSHFRSLEEASSFFRAGATGYSSTADPARFQGLELRCLDWRVEPLEVDELRSSYFEDVSRFPKGSIEFDSALLMRKIEHEWHARPDLCCSRRRIADRVRAQDPPFETR